LIDCCIVHHEIIPTDQAGNEAYYLEVLRCVMAAVWRRIKNVVPPSQQCRSSHSVVDLRVLGKAFDSYPSTASLFA
jgi:hypothetical protein